MDIQTLCLALNLFFEARGENQLGKSLVIETVFNRVEDHHYPDNVCDVVFQDNQFSWVGDVAPDDPSMYFGEDGLEQAAWDSIVELSAAAMDGSYKLPSTGSTHYHTVDVEPYWASIFTVTIRASKHIFYAEGLG